MERIVNLTKGPRMDILQSQLMYSQRLDGGKLAMESAALVRVLKALSEPTRLRILELLVQGSHCNCEVAEALGLSMSLVSHHLRVLVEAGLLVSERCPGDSRWIRYTIDLQMLRQVNQAICHLLDDGRVQTRQPSCGSWRDKSH